ncbi:hypothetical protein PG994_012936 [Apiospora phragmitis]|uniref:Uncharacterized protein n=1 Tax=Apiospora phragmitis TaxID=2905665 RepID=A0ABR1T9R3_9PEZI
MVVEQNLGPLTTAATLPSTCSDELELIYKTHTSPGYYLLQGPSEGGSCYPSVYAGVRSQYYSPATSCPFGFTPACTRKNEESETIYTCCPTQFEYLCQLSSSYQWEETLGCGIPVDTILKVTWTVVDVDEYDKTVTSTSSGAYGGVNALSIQIRFQSSDLITSAPLGNTPTPSHDSNMASDTETASSSSSSGGLSAGAAAGIAVGAFALLLAIAGAIFVLFRRRRRQKEAQPAAQLPDNYYASPAPKYAPSEMATAPQQIYEAPNVTYELEGAAR